MKKLYHGSLSLFDEIDLSESKGYKDFGKGFYASSVEQHAEKLAVRNKEILSKRQNILKARNPKFKSDPIIAYRYNLIFDEQIEDFEGVLNR